MTKDWYILVKAQSKQQELSLLTVSKITLQVFLASNNDKIWPTLPFLVQTGGKI